MTTTIRSATHTIRAYASGLAAGLLDLAGKIDRREAAFDRAQAAGIYPTQAYQDGFDFTSDLYRFRPAWLLRRLGFRP